MGWGFVQAPTYNYNDAPGSFGSYEIDEDGRFSCCDGQGDHFADCEFSPESAYAYEDEESLAEEGIELDPDACQACGVMPEEHCATCGGCPFVGMHPSSCPVEFEPWAG